MLLNIDAEMREYILDHGGRIEDGMVVIPKEQFEKEQYTEQSMYVPELRTWMLPSVNGCCLIFEGKHFIVEGDPKPDVEKAVLNAWHRFEDIPINSETDTIEAPFLYHQAGTPRKEILKWFDIWWPRGVQDLLHGNEP